MRGTVVIVDDYAPTRRLAPHFRDAGYECVRVQSTVEIPRVYQGGFRPEDYLAHIIHRGSLAVTLDELDRFGPVAVVCGSEIGVELADALSEKLGVATNGTALSAARRDKYLMVETIRAAGLRAVGQIRVGSEAELLAWYEGIGSRIVLKPERSGGNDGVRFCATAEEAVAAYRAVVGQRNIFSVRNRSVIAQEYLVGSEYILNTVSGAGRHHVCDIWQTTRVNVNGVLDAPAGRYLIPREGALQDRLVQYAYQTLDALGIQFGPAHIRIKTTSEGPCLIGVDMGIGGEDQPSHAELATGESQLNWTVDAYLNPERFAARHRDPYRIHHYVASLRMLSPRMGTLRSYPLLDRVERLESRFDVRITVLPGQPLARTVNAATCPMTVDLRHASDGVVMRDMVTLRHYDGPSFYDVV